LVSLLSLGGWLSHPLQEEVEGLLISRVQSRAVLGIDGYSVEVEVNLATGIPGISIVGYINPFLESPAETVSCPQFPV